MPHKRRSKSWTDLKQAGNECFKTGQYGEAVAQYSQAIKEVEKSGKNTDDLSILYSNRAASFLKDGNCGECVKDCTVSLDLVPFGIKPLLRRAAAYEALERYRLAYVDYKTALLVDSNIPAAHDGTNRMTKVLMEADGPSWREKLPAIPAVPMAVRERLNQNQNQAPGPAAAPASQHNGSGNTSSPAPSEEALKKALYLKEEGNALVKKGEHRKAIDKYTQSLKHNPTEITTFTNRALCYLSVKQFREAVRDCEEALRLDQNNIKALYRRALARKELKEYQLCVEDLSSLLRAEPNNSAAQKLLQEVQKKK